jgi:D-sedoheptulose 7-phosphate isomerase
MKKAIISEFNEHIKVASHLESITREVELSAQICIDCLKNGGKILLFGNGGSAADAQHFAAELVGRYKNDRRGLPAIALTTDSSILTSVGNDFGFSQIFDRQIQALANAEDVLIAISTSGRSNNVISGIKLGSKLNCKTIGLCGKNKGEMDKICDVTLAVPSKNTPRIQELHIIICHTICHLIDQEFNL